MSEPSSPSSSGLLGALKALGENLIGGLKERLELLSVEVQEEKFRLIQIFIWISAATFTAMMMLAFASFTVVYLFPEENRLLAMGGITLVYAIALVAILVAFRRYLARQPKPFAVTLHELGKDRACIQTKN